MEHEVTVTIDASPEEVWAVLADVERWPEWTASITSVEPLDGGSAFGAGSRAQVKQPGFPAATWTVTDWAPGKDFTWTARAAGVTTVADHELAAQPDGTTTVTLRLRQSGPLAGLVALLFGSRTRRYVGMEAQGLKARTEAPATA